MNYDCARPTSRVTEPPGGRSSCIFGEGETTKASTRKPNPSFHSTLFAEENEPEAKTSTSKLDGSDANETALQSVECEGTSVSEEVLAELTSESPNSAELNSDKDCEKQDDQDESNEHHFCEIKPKTSSYSRGTGLENSSTVFTNSNYPEDPNNEPGIRRRLNTASKPSSLPMSDIFGERKKACSEEHKRIGRNNLSFVSTVFDPDPVLSISNKPRSKTYKSTLNNPCRAEIFTQRRLSTSSCSRSAMMGSACDVKTEETPFIMSSDFLKTPLKAATSRPLTAPVTNSTEHLPSSSEADIISTSGSATVHYTCREKKPAVSDSYKSDGFRESVERSDDSQLCRQSPTHPVTRDPITGEIIGEARGNGAGDLADTTPGQEEKENVEEHKVASRNHEPHLGPVKTTAGVRCAQPPGGRSTFTLG